MELLSANELLFFVKFGSPLLLVSHIGDAIHTLMVSRFSTDRQLVAVTRQKTQQCANKGKE